ncbi:class I SAM-dependent methyltransferase [Thermodesulfovibrio thiophilus]|uniref:class I SAM-dependent methyltransferase n=1 Tax=Thermodesulfovibrio thiophilus TaxID=340095 RepID=UPI001843CDAE|nr:class I SAM-dependent methyltransferase [Thermodesulfovibrio thiophilus]HHW19691.1 class I SAM-dependent methyltransferase [Thermodesulfovibrio thiophilus]
MKIIPEGIYSREMNKVYEMIPLEKIPWNVETPPAVLVELVQSGKLKPCKAIDLGCGAGNYAIYLAGKGFDVTGVDISPVAIKHARENALKKGVKCRFLVTDLLGDLHEIDETFDFAYDWELLHHIFPGDRETYAKNVHKLLNPGGKYLSVCFNEGDRSFGGTGRYRKTGIGTVLYFSSIDELIVLFKPYFNIIEAKIITIKGKGIEHLANYVFMERLEI